MITHSKAVVTRPEPGEIFSEEGTGFRWALSSMDSLYNGRLLPVPFSVALVAGTACSEPYQMPSID